MATNKVFQETRSKNRARVVPEGTKAGDFVMIGDRPAVALTDRGDAVREYPVGGFTIQAGSGGVGLELDQASVAFDGTWHLPVTGATTSTGNDVAVYEASGKLTLTEGENVVVGHTDYPEGFAKTAGYAAVRIGA